MSDHIFPYKQLCLRTYNTKQIFFFKSGRNYEIRQWQIRYQCPGGWVHLELTESVRILYNLQIVHSNLPIFFVRSRLLLASSQKLTTLWSLCIENYVS